MRLKPVRYESKPRQIDLVDQMGNTVAIVRLRRRQNNDDRIEVAEKICRLVNIGSMLTPEQVARAADILARHKAATIEEMREQHEMQEFAARLWALHA